MTESSEPGPAARDPDAAHRGVQPILNDLRRLVRFVRGAAAETKERLGVTPAQWFVLQALEGSAALSLNDLAARVFADQSTASIVVSRLADRGLVTRERSARDRRRVDIALTSAGRDLLRRGAGVDSPQALLVGGIERLPDAERADLQRSLASLVRSMGLESEPAPMLFDDDGSAPPGPR